MELDITKIPDYIPADNFNRYVSIPEVYAAISCLEPFTDAEQKYIASILNKKQFHPIRDVKLDVYIEEHSYATYVHTTVGDLKKFVEALSGKLNLQTNNTVIPLHLDLVCDDDRGVLEFGLTYDSSINAARNTVVDLIKDYIQRERKCAVEKQLNAEKKKLTELQKQEREANILALITRLQNREITPEEFKTLSGAL
jgi:hypothetical protein